MQKEQLRIGNYVGATIAGIITPELRGDLGINCWEQNGFVPHQINNGKDIDNADWFFDIPLNRLWLSSFGFVLDNNKGWVQEVEVNYLVYSCKGFDIICIDDVFFLWNEMEDYYNNWYSVKIEHVHQLQNLFFLLKGKELNFTQ